MRKLVMICGVTLGLLAAVFPPCGIGGSPQQTNSASWGEATAERLSQFLPGAVSGLAPGMPWDRSTDQGPSHWAGLSAGAPPRYLPLGAQQRWVFAEPVLVQQVEEARKQTDAEGKANAQQMQTHVPRLQAQMPEYEACNKKRIAKVQELIRQGKYDEIEKVPECAVPKDPEMNKLDAKQKELSERVPKLEARTRSLLISIEGNFGPTDFLGASAQPTGTLSGHPLYRNSKATDAEFLVYVGPPGFHNPDSPTGKSTPQLKCVTVRARLHSRPETLQADEPAARQMLEKVDYAGLAKLLQP